MLAITEAETAAIHAAFEQRGELSAAVELRRLFPGITGHRAGEGMLPGHRRPEVAATGENVCPEHVTEESVPCRSPTF